MKSEMAGQNAPDNSNKVISAPYLWNLWESSRYSYLGVFATILFKNAETIKSVIATLPEDYAMKLLDILIS